jgi:hypothetical protein
MLKPIANMKKLIRKNKKFVLWLFLIITVLVIFGIWWLVKNPGSNAGKREMEAVRSTVSKLVILPAGEDPTLATVSDKNSLTDSFLKANAENGDKVLAYVKAGRVYIYRPSANKIVNIGPLVVDASASEVVGTKILVRNGSGRSGVVQTIRDQLTQNYKAATIDQNIDTAARQDYPTTIVIDLTDGDKYDLVTNIANLIGAQRGVLPIGESKPENVDILIISGLDKQ